MAPKGNIYHRMGVLLHFNSVIKFRAVHANSCVAAEAPTLSLPHVDTQLNMHQFNTFFDDESQDEAAHANVDGTTAENGSGNQPAGKFLVSSHPKSLPFPPMSFNRTKFNLPSILTILPTLLVSTTSTSHLSNPSASPNPNTGEAPTEWSAVGHAATGKSGRVIHNLQEEIARLTRECSLYRSRAEETQRSNEALKIQNQNMNERLRNLEQVNETNLNSIARKDRKIEELRTEITAERSKRADAEADASKTNETMREERENHHREQARTQEIAKYHETQYEVFSSTMKREQTDMARRVRVLYAELEGLQEAHKSHNVNAERLDVLADQKNREVEVLKEGYEKLMASHTGYKKMKDDELRGTIEKAHANNAMIDAALESVKKTEAEMKWAIQLNNNQVHK